MEHTKKSKVQIARPFKRRMIGSLAYMRGVLKGWECRICLGRFVWKRMRQVGLRFSLSSVEKLNSVPSGIRAALGQDPTLPQDDLTKPIRVALQLEAGKLPGLDTRGKSDPSLFFTESPTIPPQPTSSGTRLCEPKPFTTTRIPSGVAFSTSNINLVQPLRCDLVSMTEMSRTKISPPMTTLAKFVAPLLRSFLQTTKSL